MPKTTAKTRLNVNIDSELKNEVGDILSEIGLDYTSAINIYFKKIKKFKKIPFELGLQEETYSIEEFLGEDWRTGLEVIGDDWE
ncbi:type II toxin-antitoxin system RelB/DinJ family antitoxin [Streptococcus zalophi]|uniref:Type II toxin-antitoxin system RelB/DinJ family antitoxin n=1 Tax=Streptococcus zalophi TaxID=640031 RepID=A0A934PAW8_9STRE|nr:type II toxin-antitoxin system RelB/DinJ family antitoxin [Streptococcus zalophi]MBJ8350194.1 type II toxin-antitoxin system RelB/DinJ family antitoxin [Streptococcus zalophi]